MIVKFCKGILECLTVKWHVFILIFFLPSLAIAVECKVGETESCDSTSIESKAFDFKCVSDVSSEKPERELLNTIDKRYKDISTLTAYFIQNSYLKGLEQTQESRGRVSFKTPGMMDWRYGDPDNQRFITDATTLWYYQPNDNQVTIGDFDNSFKSDLPVSFLLGLGRLEDKFKLKKSCITEHALMVELEPVEQDASLQEFFLLVGKEDYTPRGARVVDIGGNDTTISLLNIAINEEVQLAQFKFTIPMGTDVIDRRERLTPVLVTPIEESDLAPKESVSK